MVTRRRWWMNNNNDEGVQEMPDNWAGHVKPVRAVPAVSDADHNDFVAQERQRAAELIGTARENYRTALTKFMDRVRAFHELGGDFGTEQQFAELLTLESLLTTVRGRAQLLQIRERDGGPGVYRPDGNPEPPWQPAAVADAEQWQVRDHSAAEELTEWERDLLSAQDETCTNGEDPNDKRTP